MPLAGGINTITSQQKSTQTGKIDMKSSERYPATPATRALAKAGIAFTTYIYDYDYDYDGADGRLGMHAAALSQNFC